MEELIETKSFPSFYYTREIRIVNALRKINKLITIKHNLIKADWLQVMQADRAGQRGQSSISSSRKKGQGAQKELAKTTRGC